MSGWTVATGLLGLVVFLAAIYLAMYIHWNSGE
jgi:O-antigen ligase